MWVSLDNFGSVWKPSLISHEKPRPWVRFSPPWMFRTDSDMATPLWSLTSPAVNLGIHSRFSLDGVESRETPNGVFSCQRPAMMTLSLSGAKLISLQWENRFQNSHQLTTAVGWNSVPFAHPSDELHVHSELWFNHIYHCSRPSKTLPKCLLHKFITSSWRSDDWGETR